MDQREQAVLDLQRMLNQLSQRFPQIPRTAENGVFDERTLEAVMVFQRDFSLPVTGVVDETTWNAITTAYREDFLYFGAPLDLRVLPNGEFSSPPGTISYPVLIAEALFRSLSRDIQNFRRSPSVGSDLEHTHENLRILQALSGIAVDGVLNRATWDFLARLYHIFITRDGGTL